MADPTFNKAYRIGDSDNDLLRKLLGIMSDATTGATSIDVNVAPTAAAGVVGGSALSSTSALIDNPDRRRWGIQNSGTNPLTVTFGTGVVILAPCTSQDDGRGGSITDDLWRGPVSVSGTGIRYNKYEIV